MDDRNLMDKGPQWKLVEQSGKWKFVASVDNPATVILTQFAMTRDISTGEDTSDKVRLNQWVLLKGAENEILPFGKAIPSYSVRVGKFSPIK